jgi:beta-galactosidase
MSTTRRSFLARSGAVALAVSGLASGETDGGDPSPRRRLSFNDGWRFSKGESPGAEDASFDDSHWRLLRLPHDWAIEGPFDRNINPHEGSLPYFGIAWYRKRFKVSPGEVSYSTIEFDGAMANSTVWLNGHKLGGRPNGYIGFIFDLTPYLRPAGEDNVVAVRLAPEERSARWYPGAGIYRNVWLDVTGPVHVAHWGTYITTPQVTDAFAEAVIRTQIANRGPAGAQLTLETLIQDPAGGQVASSSQEVTVVAGQTRAAETELRIARPQRWDTDHPHLYQAISLVKQDGRTVDHYVTPFGIRTISFDARRGFQLNGRHMKLQGVCLHHDQGALGTAVNRRATERQLELMKSMGVNAIRTSHNPPSPEMLDLCDHLGLMVLDEAFDAWQLAKVPNDYSKYFDEWSERDLCDQIHRDRNHPSVIVWSIGNEVKEQNSPDGWKQAARLTGICHREDPTRPTTAACSNPDAAIRNGLADHLDIFGVNYFPMKYAQYAKAHPNWIILGSETESCVSSRGVYHLPLDKDERDPSLQLSSYDVVAPSWADRSYPPDVEFAYQDELPNVLGEFVWTGIDYLGEPTPYFWGKQKSERDWPARSSYYGAVDLAGFPKDRYYLYQSHWTSTPMVHLLPHWNWQGREGQMIPVMAYSNADEVELSLNGKSLGRRKCGIDLTELPVPETVSKGSRFRSRYRVSWEAPFAPGTLRAVAYKAGKAVAKHEIRTAGAPARVVLAPDRGDLASDGDDLSFITVRIEDKDGNLCPMADNLVRFRVEGAGRLAAVDNGSSATTESFQADFRKAFSGMCLLIVRSERGKSGKIQVVASSDGLVAGEIALSTAAPGRRPAR